MSCHVLACQGVTWYTSVEKVVDDENTLKFKNHENVACFLIFFFPNHQIPPRHPSCPYLQQQGSQFSIRFNMSRGLKIARSLSRREKTLIPFVQRHRKVVSAIDDESYPKNFYPVYVHNISKIALEHLQNNQSTWLINKGLNRGLHINPNGTFTMSFPARQGFDAGRIWTSYDASTKQHWLSVYRKKLAVKFLLKDHGQYRETTMIHDSIHIQRAIHAAVDQMVISINRAEES